MAILHEQSATTKHTAEIRFNGADRTSKIVEFCRHRRQEPSSVLSHQRCRKHENHQRRVSRNNRTQKRQQLLAGRRSERSWESLDSVSCVNILAATPKICVNHPFPPTDTPPHPLAPHHPHSS